MGAFLYDPQGIPVPKERAQALATLADFQQAKDVLLGSPTWSIGSDRARREGGVPAGVDSPRLWRGQALLRMCMMSPSWTR
jgi:hypothetical protein